MTYLIRPHESDCPWREVERVTEEMRRYCEVKPKGDESVREYAKDEEDVG